MEFSKLLTFNFFIYFALLFFPLFSNAVTCGCATDTPFPALLGSTDGPTVFLSMDVNPSQTLIAGGYSQSSLLVGSSSKTPIIVSFDTTTGSYNWKYYLNNLQGRIWLVKYQNLVYAQTALIFIPTSSTSPLRIIIISSTSGSIISCQKIAAPNDQNQVFYNRLDYDILRLYSQPLIYSSTGMIYMGIDYNTQPQTQQMYFSLMAFSVNPVALTTTWKQKNGYGFSLMSSVIFGKDESQLLAGGSTNIMGVTNPSLQLMQTSDGTINWRIQSGSINFYNTDCWDFYQITSLFYISGATPKVVANGDSFWCTHNMILIVDLDSSTNYLSNSKFDYQYPGGRCAWGKSIYAEMSRSNVVVYQLAHNLGWATYGFGDGYMYLTTFNSANSYVQVQKIANVGGHSSIFAQEMACSSISSATQMYFGGYADKLFDSSYSQTFSQSTGFILNAAATGNIITLSFTSSSQSSSGFAYSFTLNSDYLQNSFTMALTTGTATQAVINMSNNVQPLPVTTSTYSCNTGTLTLSIYPPTVVNSLVTCEVDVICDIAVGLYMTAPTNCQDSTFIFSLFKDGIVQDGTTYASFPMTMSTTSNYIQLSMTPTISMASLSYTLMVNAILDEQPQLTDTSFSFTFHIQYPTITAPTISSPSYTSYATYPLSIPLGQYCYGTSPSLATCQGESLTYSLLINGSSQVYGSFPMDILNSQNDITLTITPPSNLIFSTTTVTLKSLITSLPSIFESSYTFTLTVVQPEIVAPAVASPIVKCMADYNCSIPIGLYSLSPISGPTLLYAFTQNNLAVTPLSYQFYQMNLDTTGNNLTFYFVPQTKQIDGSYSIKVTASILEFPLVSDQSYVFTIQVTRSCSNVTIIASPIIQNISYKLGSDPYVFAFDKFTLSDESCESQLQTLYFVLEDGEVLKMKFTTVKQPVLDNRIVTLYTNNTNYLGLHLYTVTCTICNEFEVCKAAFVNILVEIYNTSSSFTATESPTFSVGDKTIIAGQTVQMPIGTQILPFMTVKFYFGAMAKFSQYDSVSQNFTFSPSAYDVGSYIVKGAVFSDRMNTKVDFKFALTVTAQPEKITTQVSNSSVAIPNTTIKNDSTLVAQEESATMGIYRITGVITKISSQGVMTIQFNSSLSVMKDVKSWTQSDMEITLIYASNDSTVKVNYSDVSVAQKIMTIQLNFESPEELSVFSDWDQIYATYKNEELVQYLGKNWIGHIRKNYRLQRGIPPQMSNSDSIFSQMEQIAAAIMSTMNSVIFGNFAVNLILSTSMQSLWGMFSSFQIITHLPLFTITVPAQLNVISYFMIQTCSFNFVPIQNVIDSLFIFDLEQESYSDQFSSMGYISYNILVNNGSLIVILLFNIGLTVLMMIFSNFVVTNHVILAIQSYLVSAVLYSFLLQFLMEGFLDYFLCCIINVQKLNTDLSGELAGSISSIASLAILSLLPVIATFKLYKSKHSEESTLDEKYSALADGLLPDKMIYYNVIGLLRMSTIAAAAVFLKSMPGFQLIMTMIGNLISALFLIKYSPFEDQKQNKMELYNEISIYVICLVYLAFTDFNQNIYSKQIFGWVGVMAIIQNFFGNIGNLVVQIVKKLYNYCKNNLQLKKQSEKNKQKYRMNQQLSASSRSLVRNLQGINENQSSPSLMIQERGKEPQTPSKLETIQESITEEEKQDFGLVQIKLKA